MQNPIFLLHSDTAVNALCPSSTSLATPVVKSYVPLAVLQVGRADTGLAAVQRGGACAQNVGEHLAGGIELPQPLLP